MTYSPGLPPVLPMVSPFTFGISALAHERTLPSAPASLTYESANNGAYFPILVPGPCIIRRLWWANGSTVSASYNVDVGIYADGGYKPGAKIISTGSTAQGTATEVQFVDVTDTTLAPGLYWLAIACSSTSATFFGVATNTVYNAVTRFTQATALPLPATATVAEAATNQVYLFGFATTASP